jgi:hypothetical protein
MSHLAVPITLVAIAPLMVASRLTMVVRGRLMIKSGIAVMMGTRAPLLTGFRRFFGIPVVRGSLRMSGAAAHARDLTLSLRIHRCESTSLCHFCCSFQRSTLMRVESWFLQN